MPIWLCLHTKWLLLSRPYLMLYRTVWAERDAAAYYWDVAVERLGEATVVLLVGMEPRGSRAGEAAMVVCQ